MNPSEYGSTSTRSGSGLAAVPQAARIRLACGTIKLLEDAGIERIEIGASVNYQKYRKWPIHTKF